LASLRRRPPRLGSSAHGRKVSRPHVDDDSKNASSMLNAHDLRFYTATLRFIVDDSLVLSCGTLGLPSV
jgi:hypothetical protein